MGIESAAGTPFKVVNDSDNRLLFSSFKAGDSGLAFDTVWVEPHETGTLKVGNFKALSVGVQARKAGKWLGGDPKEPPYGTPGQTVTLTITKKFS
jgi:hypothetical protein